MPSKSKAATHPHVAPVKIYCTPLRIMAAVPMPGLEPEDIVVEVAAAGQLIVQGQRRGELKGIKDELLNEWGVGRLLPQGRLARAGRWDARQCHLWEWYPRGGAADCATHEDRPHHTRR